MTRDLENSRVFGIGFHKTGTTTLGQALEELGYAVCHGARPVREAMGHRRMMERLHANDLDGILDVAEHFEAFEDNPWFMLYRAVDQRFPGSRFILTVRDEQRWLDSALKYYGQSVSDLRQWIYGIGSPVGHEEVFLERYRRHNRDVLDYFAGRPGDLLVLDWEKGHGWPELSGFLVRPVPAARFPHANPDKPRPPVKKEAQGSSEMSTDCGIIGALNTQKSVAAPEAIDLRTVLVRSGKLVHSAVDGEISMLNVETGKYFGLASVGARIWALLAEPMTVQGVCDRLMSEYRVDRTSCEADVLRFVKHMFAEGVVTTAPAE